MFSFTMTKRFRRIVLFLVRNKSGKILDILDDIFKGTDITYTVVDKQIILSTNKMQLVQQEGQIK